MSEHDGVIDNKALAPLAFLEGTWRVRLSNAEFLADGQVLDGTMVGSWLAGRGLLVLESTMPDGPPTSVQVIGRNESLDDFEILYADERGVSRIYSSSFDGERWMQHREDPGFHQRFEGRVLADSTRIEASWARSHDAGATWIHDFDLVYTKA